ncbi:hypothetical protein [Streptomyces sp. CRN 30]|uniref:hypothetical protein n=1 Tax=Streptomyces sp. CRN 30 TaxID=3075613 RepID=UPI002A7ED28F|nr:hypothetical protein [Streptomyces sp. CRN 30]
MDEASPPGGYRTFQWFDTALHGGLALALTVATPLLRRGLPGPGAHVPPPV